MQRVHLGFDARHVDDRLVHRLVQRMITRHLDALQLGELYETRHDTAQAIRAYNDFVELWKDADTSLQPAVANIRQRIAGLIGDASVPRSTR